jgi:hypothetical protein
MTKPIQLHPGDRATRAAMREAHDLGRHGDGTQPDVLAYWASICADCNATWRYERATATRLP